MSELRVASEVSVASKVVLRKHHLRHLPELGISENIFEGRFQEGCSMQNCNAKCCREGVYADLREREKILSHAELIQRHMEPHQEHNPAQWFDDVEEADTDFPSGKSVGTRTRNGGCVFLKHNGHCVLQVAATEEGLGKFDLKPFFCVAFPITIENGVLMIDDAEFTNQPQCCSTVPGGLQNIFDVCAEEIEFVLGVEGTEELKAVSNIRFSQK